jgi:predicted XRE-type DNA-binding protein
MKVHDFEEFSERVLADPKRRANIERHRTEAVTELLEYTLSQLRRHREMTQAQLSEALGITQPSVSSLEHADNLELSTLRSYIEALGGTLEITAVIGSERFPLAIP